jgi:hypothetical protein
MKIALVLAMALAMVGGCKSPVSVANTPIIATPTTVDVERMVRAVPLVFYDGSAGAGVLFKTGDKVGMITAAHVIADGDAEKETPKITEYYLKKENFEKIKKAFESKSQSDRTKEDVDAYNKAVKDMNVAVNISNEASTNANNKRNELYKTWEEAVKTFYDTNVPHYR